MSKQYGALELSMQTLTIIAIIAVITLTVATVLHALDYPIAFVAHLVGFSLTTVLIATLWTDAAAWDRADEGTFFIGLALLAVAGYGPFLGVRRR